MTVTGRVVGRVTSVAWSPSLATVVALGYLHRDVEVPGPVGIHTGEAPGDVVGAEARILPLVG
jgi:glycine cleavage system aminomethyltransferase T